MPKRHQWVKIELAIPSTCYFQCIKASTPQVTVHAAPSDKAGLNCTLRWEITDKFVTFGSQLKPTRQLL